MKKSALILFISLPFILFSVKAYAEVCISQWQDYYCYWNHWLSDEGWGAEVTDFDDADKVYCNVSAGMGAPEPWKSPSFYELRWFKRDGERESNIGTCFNGYSFRKRRLFQWRECRIKGKGEIVLSLRRGNEITIGMIATCKIQNGKRGIRPWKLMRATGSQS